MIIFRLNFEHVSSLNFKLYRDITENEVIQALKKSCGNDMIINKVFETFSSKEVSRFCIFFFIYI